jgi:protein-S-isoprenylcysteine O-methyltransferase Ste14
MLANSMIELGGRIMMPYKLNEIIHSRTLTYASYEANNLEGLKQSGIYAYVRNPMQGAVLIIIVFGNGIYTTERLVYILTMGLGVLIGVFMEEKRMLAQFKDYKDYMRTVKARFIPFIPIL